MTSNSVFKTSIFCKSRGNEAQISSETKIYLETPHVVSYFINGLLTYLAHSSNQFVRVRRASARAVDESGRLFPNGRYRGLSLSRLDNPDWLPNNLPSCR